MIKTNIKELLFSFLVKEYSICYYQFFILSSKLQGTYAWICGGVFVLFYLQKLFLIKAKCFQSAGVIHSVTENNQTLNLLLWAFRPDFMKETSVHIKHNCIILKNKVKILKVGQ